MVCHNCLFSLPWVTIQTLRQQIDVTSRNVSSAFAQSQHYELQANMLAGRVGDLTKTLAEKEEIIRLYEAKLAAAAMQGLRNRK